MEREVDRDTGMRPENATKPACKGRKNTFTAYDISRKAPYSSRLSKRSNEINRTTNRVQLSPATLSAHNGHVTTTQDRPLSTTADGGPNVHEITPVHWKLALYPVYGGGGSAFNISGDFAASTAPDHVVHSCFTGCEQPDVGSVCGRTF